MSGHKLFLSYSRRDDRAAQALGAELEELGQQVWIDTQLSGGQQWWNTILERIRTCDCFVFLISADSLSSKACMAELDYAHRLGRFVLPVTITDKIHDPLLPHHLAETQRIDVSNPKSATYALAKALMSLPSNPTLPDPLPEAPPVPISYLDELAQAVGGPELNKTQQVTLVADLKQRLGEEGERDSVIALLEQLKRRPDLYAAVSDDITQVLAGARLRTPTPPAPEPPRVPPPPTVAVAPPVPSKPSRPRRAVLIAACSVAVLAVGGAAVAAASAAGGSDSSDRTTASTDGPPSSPATEPPATTSPATEPPPTSSPDTEPPTTTDVYTEQSDLCANGDAAACDLLADVCMDGDTMACQALYDSTAYDSVGEALARCGLGSYTACDDLYLSAEASSQYELFGSTCGGQYDRTDGNCMAWYG